MLQIITEKFFPPGERYETLHRAIFYTNYRVMDGEKLVTPVGALLPSSGLQPLANFTCEIVEKQPKYPDGTERPGILIATSGHELLNDFAAVVSFALNVTCSTDENLVRRLLSTDRMSLNVEVVPSKLIQRTFDKDVYRREGDAANLSAFVTQLIGLERRTFEGAMRAIRRFVTGTHRITDELSLAYALFVMSIEALAQEFDTYVPDWTDYEHSKRIKIDAALSAAPSDIAADVRAAILSNEHVALSRRFRDFAMDHIAPSFFREEATVAHRPLSRTDLAMALQQAYSIRSAYVHSLKNAPPELAVHGFADAIEVDHRATLTYAGLARVARHIISQFVQRGRIVEQEEFNYRRAIPGIVNVQLDPHYWIAATTGFTYRQAPLRLTGFLEQWTSVVLQRTPNAKFTDIRPLLEKIEEILPGLNQALQRIPMLTMYFLFHQILPRDQHLPNYQKIMERYGNDFAIPSIESFVASLLTDQTHEWSLEQYSAVHASYFELRRRAKGINVGRLIEAALSLRVAELYRADGNEERARSLLAFAVETIPGHSALRAFEETAANTPLPEIDWTAILLPRDAPTDAAETAPS